MPGGQNEAFQLQQSEKAGKFFPSKISIKVNLLKKKSRVLEIKQRQKQSENHLLRKKFS